MRNMNIAIKKTWKSKMQELQAEYIKCKMTSASVDGE